MQQALVRVGGGHGQDDAADGRGLDDVSVGVAASGEGGRRLVDGCDCDGDGYGGGPGRRGLVVHLHHQVVVVEGLVVDGACYAQHPGVGFDAEGAARVAGRLQRVADSWRQRVYVTARQRQHGRRVLRHGGGVGGLRAGGVVVVDVVDRDDDGGCCGARAGAGAVRQLQIEGVGGGGLAVQGPLKDDHSRRRVYSEFAPSVTPRDAEGQGRVTEVAVRGPDVLDRDGDGGVFGQVGGVRGGRVEHGVKLVHVRHRHLGNGQCNGAQSANLTVNKLRDEPAALG